VNKHLAIVEDDPDVRAILERSLAADGFVVTALASGAELEPVLAGTPHALVIVDLGLPDVDGLTLTRRIRDSFDVGIIIVSGRGDLADRVVGLELGADDYVTKPFEPREIVARVRSVLRRSERRAAVRPAVPAQRVRSFEGFALDLDARMLRDNAGNEIALTSGEYRMVEALVTHPNRVLSREQLLDLVHDNDMPAYDRSIDVCIGRIRRKLADNSRSPKLIKTVRNGGYIFAGRVMAAQ
jgi:two-component system OmpR family response regulator